MSDTFPAERIHHPESPLATHDGLIWTIDRARMVSPSLILDRMAVDCRMLRHQGHFGMAGAHLLALGWTPSQVARFSPRALTLAIINAAPAARLPGPPPTGVPMVRQILGDIAEAGVLGLLVTAIALLCPSAGHAAEALGPASLGAAVDLGALLLLAVGVLLVVLVTTRPIIDRDAPFDLEGDFGDQPTQPTGRKI